ncbi:MAG: hypothetical protein QM747_14450 [Nocardioides sp.]
MSHGSAGMSGQRFCVVGGWDTTRHAESGYWSARDLIGCGYPYVGTTFEGAQHVVVSGADDPLDLPDQTRLFVFPGMVNLSGMLAVGDLLLISAIDEVRTVGGQPACADDLLDTRDHLRPRMRGGRVVLTVRPEGRILLAFEQPDHATPYVAH